MFCSGSTMGGGRDRAQRETKPWTRRPKNEWRLRCRHRPAKVDENEPSYPVENYLEAYSIWKCRPLVAVLLHAFTRSSFWELPRAGEEPHCKPVTRFYLGFASRWKFIAVLQCLYWVDQQKTKDGMHLLFCIPTFLVGLRYGSLKRVTIWTTWTLWIEIKSFCLCNQWTLTFKDST